MKNLSDVIVENEKEMNTLLERGMKSRHVAATLMNAESSRSHSIFTIIVEMGSKDESGKDKMLHLLYYTLNTYFNIYYCR